MPQQVQELIDKIKTEGVQSAEEKAREIEGEAKKHADEIIANAKKDAERLIIDAKEEVKKMQEATHMSLKQASRDTLLSLRKEIEKMLNRVVQKEVSDSLTADQLSKIISAVAQDSMKGIGKSEEVRITLSAKDQDALKKTFVSKLQKEIKAPITLQSSDEILKGFTISFDSGKSTYDFSDESLALFLTSFLNDQISTLVKDSV